MDYRNAQIAEIYHVVNPWSEDLDFHLTYAQNSALWGIVC